MSRYIAVKTYSIGTVDPNTVVKVVKEVTEEDKRRQALMDARPPLDEILNLHDFEVSLPSDNASGLAELFRPRLSPKLYFLPRLGLITPRHQMMRSLFARIAPLSKGK